jgi:tRNA(fMet)-specific endonuclease VapC
MKEKRITEENLTGDWLVCLDTNVIIDFLNGEKKIIELINSYAQREIISITAITEYELLKHKDKIKREIAEGVINSMQVYPFDRKSAAEAARVFEILTSIGKMIKQNDILIAGIAIANNELLITRDTRFKDMGNEKILIV